jgi:hypothetical protein
MLVEHRQVFPLRYFKPQTPRFVGSHREPSSFLAGFRMGMQHSETSFDQTEKWGSGELGRGHEILAWFQKQNLAAHPY